MTQTELHEYFNSDDELICSATLTWHRDLDRPSTPVPESALWLAVSKVRVGSFATIGEARRAEDSAIANLVSTAGTPSRAEATDGWLDVDQAAAQLPFGATHIRRAIRTGELRAERSPHDLQWRTKEEWIDEWLMGEIAQPG